MGARCVAQTAGPLLTDLAVSVKTALLRAFSFGGRWSITGLALACALLAVVALPVDAQAQAPEHSTDVARQVKAAYLYKFASYVEWPSREFADAKSPLTIGVMGEDALADELAYMVASRTVNGRPVAVRKVRRTDDALGGIHILFVGRLEKSKLPEILAGLKGRPILTVTDADDALALGSMVNFVVTGDRLRFEVALPAAETSRIKISALMLAAAYKVVKEPS